MNSVEMGGKSDMFETKNPDIRTYNIHSSFVSRRLACEISAKEVLCFVINGDVESRILLPLSTDLCKSLFEGTLEVIMWSKWGSSSIPFGRGDLQESHNSP